MDALLNFSKSASHKYTTITVKYTLCKYMCSQFLVAYGFYLYKHKVHVYKLHFLGVVGSPPYIYNVPPIYNHPHIKEERRMRR